MANNFHISFHTNQFRKNIHWGENIFHVQYIPKFHFLREIYTLERNITFCYWSNLASKLSVHRHHKYKFYYAVENETKKLMIYFSISLEVQILPSMILKSNQTTYIFHFWSRKICWSRIFKKWGNTKTLAIFNFKEILGK